MCFLFCLFLLSFCFFFFNDTATTEIYTLSLHDALPIFAHLPDLVPARSHERDVRRADDVREFGVFRQEAVARVDRVSPGDLRGGDDARNVEVAVAGGRATDAHVVVREPRVQAVPVRLRVDGDRIDVQLLARTDHPQGDLPAVRDQHLLEHQGVMSPRSPAAAVVPPNAWLSPESTPETFSANSLGFVA